MDDLNVNITDIGIAVILLISALLAFMRGFVHEVLSIGGWVGAIFATIYGLPQLRSYVRGWIANDLAADLTTGALIFVSTLVVLSFFTRSVSKRIRDSALNALDRSLGFLFGLLRGAILICIAYIGFEIIMPPPEQPAKGAGEEVEEQRPEWLLSARGLPLVQTGAELLKSLVPDGAGGAAESAREAQEKVRKLLENQKMLHEMIIPEIKNEKPNADSGYGRSERRSMDRLIDSNR
ncbi:MAG: CvpA family protein [Rhodospirillales bacterium]